MFGFDIFFFTSFSTFPCKSDDGCTARSVSRISDKKNWSVEKYNNCMGFFKAIEGVQMLK